LREVVLVGLLKNLKAMKEAAAAGLRGEGPSEEALAALTPEQRAAYDAQLAAHAAAQAQVAAGQQEIADAQRAREEARPLAGPAGEWRYGTGPEGLDPEQLATVSPSDQIAQVMAASKAQFRDALRNPLGGSGAPPVPPPVPGASADRGEQAAAERAMRDAARMPYRSPSTGPISFTRLAARGKTQIDEVCAYLGSSGLAGRPDLVFGAYRVPDVIGTGTLGGQGSKVVEWDIVHGATEALPPAPAATATWFDGEELWVERAIGEPSVLDEDLAIALLGTAGAGPDRSLGIARMFDVRSRGGDDTGGSTTVLRVTGAQVIHTAELPTPQAFDHLDGRRPLDLPHDGPPGVRVEVLNWAAIASAVHPAHHKAVPIPSPFPYLPSTPQELLRAYLEVVGVHPAHCYSVSVAEDGARGIDGTGTKAGFTYTTNVGEEQPCADGTLRRRLNGGRVVVIAYLDGEAYAEGRERWAAYERDVLHTRLHLDTGARRPVEQPLYDDLPGGIRTLVKVVDRVDSVFDGNDPFEGIAPHRYCWPPRDAR
jgi:hypothetical protein